MVGTLLVVNSGSSSVKFSAYAVAERPSSATMLSNGEVEAIGHEAQLHVTGANGDLLCRRQIEGSDHAAALSAILAWVEEGYRGHPLRVAGHRIVHGGRDFAGPIRIDDVALAALRALAPLAPLHQPHNLAAVDAVKKLHPTLPQVACFDTAFHHGLTFPENAFALPRELLEAGVQRYGFHGLSYEYIAGLLPEHLDASRSTRVVVAHLGSGASMCAIRNGKSIATTMGFTALDGLPMGTRCGSIDPGVLLYLLQQKGMSVEALGDLLYHRSGLLGLSGISDDMRDLLASSSAAAREAVDLFVYRLGRELGSLVAALEGLDALVFTAGIGEHAAEIRRRVCGAASWLGIQLDETANGRGGPLVSKGESRVSVLVLPTDEDLMIARHTWDTVFAA